MASARHPVAVIDPEQLPRDLRVKTGVDYEYLGKALNALSNPLRLRLLGFLTTWRYLEEIGSELKMSRQAARKHLDLLLELGVIERRAGMRETGPVTEYILNPQALFLVHDEFEKLGSLRRRGDHAPGRTLPSAEGGRGPPPAGPAFHVVRGMETGRCIPLRHGERRAWAIGRDPACEVVVAHDPYASARHAEVRYGPDGFALADLGSTNGTQLNWAQLPREGQAALRHGDVVGVGKTLLVFSRPSW